MKTDVNERLTQIGPGTEMGALFRRFWLPAITEAEVGPPDSSAVSLRILGEDLVAFRDTNGRIGVLDAYCAHRRAGLIFGRVENCGLRCIYHGWKFDVDGNCVDVPSEPPERQEKMRSFVKITAYPTQVRGGVVWVYMGPPEEMPPFPEFEWSRFAAERRSIIRRRQPCNFAQAIEGGIDSSHISFLHRDHPQANKSEIETTHSKYARGCRHPEFTVEETVYGLQIIARRWIEGNSKNYWRVTQFMLPCFQMVPPILDNTEFIANPTYGNIWVPIDDYNTWNWGFCSDVDPLSEATRHMMGPHGLWGDLDDRYLPLQNKENMYAFSQERQRTINFSGIAGVRNQDAAVVESMGPVVDRTRENLGHSDSAIVKFRLLMLRLAKRISQGERLEAPHQPEIFNIRSFSVLLDKDIDLRGRMDEFSAGEPLLACNQDEKAALPLA